MDLLIIRHAIARDRAKFARTGRPDAERPLTADGRRKFRRCVKGLRRAVKRVDVFATSPYVRARETCAIAAKAYPNAKVVALPDLAHRGNDRGVVRWLSGRAKKETVALVGHEPDLGRLTAHLTGTARPGLTFKKGGAALVSFEGRVAAGAGRLVWLLTPSVLKRLR
jgi:phosphohistidine phosphatase